MYFKILNYIGLTIYMLIYTLFSNTLHIPNNISGQLVHYIILSILISLIISWWGYKKKHLLFDAAIFVFCFGFLISLYSASIMMALSTFFICGSIATKFKSRYKLQFDPDYLDKKQHNGRNLDQVLCNGGVPALISLYQLLRYFYHSNSFINPNNVPQLSDNFYESIKNHNNNNNNDNLKALMINDYLFAIIPIASYIAACCGDTLASELAPITSVFNIFCNVKLRKNSLKNKGNNDLLLLNTENNAIYNKDDDNISNKVSLDTHNSVVNGPILITTGQPVPCGTNGGVTVIGLAYSALGGLIIGCALVLGAYLNSEWSLFSTQSDQIDGIYSHFTSAFSGKLIGLMTYCGLLGSIMDSILGSLFQFSGINTETGKMVNFYSKEVSKDPSLSIYQNNDKINKNNRNFKTDKLSSCHGHMNKSNDKVLVLTNSLPILDNNNVNLISASITSFIGLAMAYTIF